MKYRLRSTRSFEKGFRNLDIEARRRCDAEIRQLQDNPYIGKPLHGDLKGKYSLRSGDYRVIYSVDEADKSVLYRPIISISWLVIFSSIW